MINKATIYLDCDDTILRSSETVINILNKRYKTNKTINDLTDWHYRSIVPFVGQEEILDIYDSEEFWNEVKLNEEFVKVFNLLKNDFKWIIVSKGKSKNLELKEKFINENLNNKEGAIPLIGLKILNSSSDFNKASVDMKNGIQIDDKMESLLGTNAACRIILQNGRVTNWNKIEANEDNLYQVHNWNDIKEILIFFKDHPEMIRRCYPDEEEI